MDAIADLDLSIPEGFISKYGGVGSLIDFSQPYLVVLQHPVTTEFGSGLDQINETLAAIRELNIQTVWLWPNVDAGSDDISKGLRMFREQNSNAPIHFYRNFEVEDYARLIANCACLVGNSSSGLREGAFLGTPVVNIGTRQNKRERSANVLDAGYDRQEIHDAVRKQLENGRYASNPLFGDGTSGRQIAELLATVHVTLQKSITY